MKIALLVCTRNRSPLLVQLLQELSNVIVPASSTFKILVVDNGSSDDTKEVVKAAHKNMPVNYLYEARTGKSYALNTGIANLQNNDLILFIDDDVRIPRNWVAAFINAAQAAPEYDWFGGRVLPKWPNSRPKWLHSDTRQALSGYFIDYELGDVSRPYNEADKLPIGAAMAVRSRVFKAIGEFREDLGPREYRGMGEDTEFIMRAIDAKFSGYYVADAVAEHIVDQTRLSAINFIRFGYAKGLNQYRMGQGEYGAGSLKRASSQLLRGFGQLIRNRRDRFCICLINFGIEIGRRRASGRAGYTT